MLNNTWFGSKVQQNQPDSSFTKNAHQPSTQAAANANNYTVQPLRLEGLQEPHKLSHRQMAARQSTPKDLPKFDGHPEDWPLFISSYENSTRICAFSDDENLGRLRACLKGRALEAVRSRLSHPGQVDKIISTLQMMFGRPEIIINALLQKIRHEPQPKADKLDSIVKYSLDVENICATMQMAGCSSHLNNPILLQELVERLPPIIRLNWSIYRQTLPTTDISHFSTWLFELGRAANDITFTCPIAQEKRLEQKQRHCLSSRRCVAQEM